MGDVVLAQPLSLAIHELQEAVVVFNPHLVAEGLSFDAPVGIDQDRADVDLAVGASLDEVSDPRSGGSGLNQRIAVGAGAIY